MVRDPDTPSPPLLGSFQLYWPPHAAHHQLHCVLALFQMFKRVSVTRRAHVGQCDPSCPSTGTMIRLKESELRNAFSLIGPVPRLVVALLQLRHHPHHSLSASTSRPPDPPRSLSAPSSLAIAQQSLCSKPCAPWPVANLPHDLFSATTRCHCSPFSLGCFVSSCLIL